MENTKRHDGGPDLMIEAIVERVDEATGARKHTYIPVGAAWRSESGDGYVGELRAQPIEWQFTSVRRVFLRVRGDG